LLGNQRRDTKERGLKLEKRKGDIGQERTSTTGLMNDKGTVLKGGNSQTNFHYLKVASQTGQGFESREQSLKKQKGEGKRIETLMGVLSNAHEMSKPCDDLGRARKCRECFLWTTRENRMKY